MEEKASVEVGNLRNLRIGNTTGENSKRLQKKNTIDMSRNGELSQNFVCTPIAMCSKEIEQYSGKTPNSSKKNPKKDRLTNR